MSLFPRLVVEKTAEYRVAGGRVRLLPAEVALQDRSRRGRRAPPASAVKDLVENVLDAGASRIEVDIEDGGISLIRVRDDEHRMSPGDAERAIAEHATSKIQSADDLARVESLGFRGRTSTPSAPSPT